MNRPLAAMRNHKIRAGIFICILLAASFTGGLVVKGLTGSKSGDQAKSTCTDRLRQTMEDMHRQMYMVSSSGDVDEDFARLMLPHHQAAIEMAKVELLCGKDPANRRLAQEIIVEQQSEIELMRLWLSKRDSNNRSGTGRQEKNKQP